MTFDSISRYTEESIKCTKEFQKFLIAKTQLEADFAQKMVKLCQGAMLQFSASLPDKKMASVTKAEEKNQVLKTSLWKTFVDLVQQIHDNAITMKTVSTNVETEIINPFSTYIKEMEIHRKALVDEGIRQTNLLQDTYVALKKAKQNHDDAVAAFTETKEAHQKISRAPNTKEKDIDKWNQKLQQASEKVTSLDTAYKQCDDVCKSAQIKFWQQTIPDILQQLYAKEEERCILIHDSLKNWAFVEKQYGEYLLKADDYMMNKIETADLTSDFEELFTEHMQAIEGEDAGGKTGGAIPSISVRSLVNPIKAGRMLKKADENDTSWKPRYFVLMGDRQDPRDPAYQPGSGRLYYFESEDALKPKGIVDLAVATVYAVDDSLFANKSNILVILTTLTTTENNELVTKQKLYYLSAENAEERDLWVGELKKYAMCCMPCIVTALAEPVTLNLDNTENVVVNFPKANPREYYYRTIKSLRLWIMEAKELNMLDPVTTMSPNQEQPSESSFFPLVQRQQFSPFCTINVGEARIARTTTKSVPNPFWGEEFLFDKLAECETEFRIIVNAQTKRKDMELGYVDVKLSQFYDPSQAFNVIGKKWDSWLTLTSSSNGITGGETSGQQPGVRISAMVTEESILPLYEYPIFVNCLFGNDFRILKTLAKSAERCTTFARDDFARSLVNVIVATQSDIAAIRALLQVDVEATEDANIIFRGNTLATKTIDQYMKFIGSEFLKNTLSGLIRMVYEKANKQESCEVDPTRIDNPTEEVLKKHQKRLLQWVQTFWDTIQNSVERAPRNLREALQSIREMVTKQFTKRSKENSNQVVQFSAVSGFIFLRFLCPAILSPKLFGLWPEVSENATATRTLTLIAKVLQNLANLSDFKSKEPHMEFCNQWILWNLDAMKTCIVHFSTVTQNINIVDNNEERFAFLIEHINHVDLSRELNHLYVQIKANLPDLQQQLEEIKALNSQQDTIATESQQIKHQLYKRIDPEYMQELFDYLKRLEEMYDKYVNEWDQNRNQLNECPHLQKQLQITSHLHQQLAPTTVLPIPLTVTPETTQRLQRRIQQQGGTSRKVSISTPTLVNSTNMDMIITTKEEDDLKPPPLMPMFKRASTIVQLQQQQQQQQQQQLPKDEVLEFDQEPSVVSSENRPKSASNKDDQEKRKTIGKKLFTKLFNTNQ